MMQRTTGKTYKERFLLWLLAAVLVCTLFLPFAQGVLQGAAEDTTANGVFAPESAAENNSQAIENDKKENIIDYLCYFIEDLLMFDINNLDPVRVSLAHFFAGYDGQLVFIGNWENGRSGSFGRIMGLHKNVLNTGSITWLSEILKHEHGHYEQYKRIGLIKYIFAIAIPSLLNDPADYYSQPWEVTADILGGVTIHRHSAGSEEAGIAYLNNVIKADLFSFLSSALK